jgi:hypothetical protein
MQNDGISMWRTSRKLVSQSREKLNFWQSRRIAPDDELVSAGAFDTEAGRHELRHHFRRTQRGYAIDVSPGHVRAVEALSVRTATRGSVNVPKELSNTTRLHAGQLTLTAVAASFTAILRNPS